MEVEGRRIDYREADYRCTEPERRLDAGEGDLEEFDEQREQLITRDDEGHWSVMVARPASASTTKRTALSGAWHHTTSGHRRTAFYITGCSLSGPNRFSRETNHGRSTSPYRYPSMINRLVRTRSRIDPQTAMEGVRGHTLWLRCWKDKSAKRSTRRKG
jgi:hypothetical protein